MDTPSLVFTAAFLGSMLGLPAGFLVKQVLLRLLSEKDDPVCEHIEWAITQRGCVIVEENQVANNWVRTYDFENLHTLGNNKEIVPLDTSMLPGRFATQVVGSIGTPTPVPSDDFKQARINHEEALRKTRKALGLPVS